MRVAFLGDIALIGKYDISIHGYENCMGRFSAVRQILQDCDYVVANLEAPFTDLKTTREAKTLPLKSDARNVEILVGLGVNAVSLANNHVYDYGEQALNQTISVLKDRGIEYFGVDDKIVVVDGEDARIGLAGLCCRTTNAWHYNDQSDKGRLCPLSVDSVRKALDESEKRHAFPVLCFHWGEENTHYPRREHVDIARLILDSYKALIVGHHPHVIQGAETRRNGVVSYSLGNFCFDDCVGDDEFGMVVRQTEDNKKGVVLIATIKGNRIESTEYIGFVDCESGLLLDDKIGELPTVYGSDVRQCTDWAAYQEKRFSEMHQASTSRLGKRDFNWLRRRLNKKAIFAVLQRKKNQKDFGRIAGEFDAF